MKLYAVSDGPPSLCVRLTLAALEIPYELKLIDFYGAAEHASDDFAKMNPQKEAPVIEDNGFYLGESIAIMQYLCDKYGAGNSIYPTEPQARALVNHRLCFNMGYYYSNIIPYAVAPIYFDYERNEIGLKRVNMALSTLEKYLQISGTKYAAGNTVTLADFALVGSTLCLEAINFELTDYPLVMKWYELFKTEYPKLWKVADGYRKEIAEYNLNPPDLSHIEHPIHPVRKNKK